MSKISITELHLAGLAFFSESENFLKDLMDEAILTQLNGGIGFSIPVVIPSLTRTVSPALHKDREPILYPVPPDPYSGRYLP